MKFKLCLLWFSLLIAFSIPAFGGQTKGSVQITLKLQEGNSPLGNQEIYIGQTLRYSQPDNGTVVFEIPSEQTFFTVTVPGKVIVLPEGGIVYRPADTNHVITILLGSAREKQAFEVVNRKLLDLTHSVKDLSEYVQKSQELLENYINQNNLVLEQYKVQQFLELQHEKQFKIEGQLKTIPLLAGSLDFYISRTKDLLDILDRNKEKVLNDNGRIVNEINKKISAYNESYEKLNSERETIINYVENYWGEGSLLEQTRHLLEDALQNIHQMQLLISNNLLTDINDFIDGKKGHPNKASIKRDISNTTDRTRILIENLDKDKTRIVQKMKEYYQS